MVIGLKKVRENAMVYGIGAGGYTLLEILWRGHTHWTMTLTGGLCFWLVYCCNSRLSQRGLLSKCLAGSSMITAVEFFVGRLVNVRLGWNVWDYSSQPFNLGGQVCALYSFLWFLLCMPLCPLCGKLKQLLSRPANRRFPA